MGAIYLTDLADVLRAAGCTVIEVPGWRTRGRSTGGYEPGRPNSLMVHHTASPPTSDGWRDAEYVNTIAADRPMCNLLIDRRGQVWVCAAGATNTNGRGVDTWGGGVPNDRMNEWAIGVEIANTGVGEPYPTVQQDAVMTAAVAICRRYRIVPHRVRGHFEWAPTRKIDPSGPSRWAPSGGKWSMDAFRADITDALTPIIPDPTPDPEEDEMKTAGIAAIYQPTEEMVAAGHDKTFVLLSTGDVRHAAGPDAELDRERVPIRGIEHYQQCEALDAVWRSRS